MICSLAESGLDGFTIVLAIGLISVCKTWKPISNIAVWRTVTGQQDSYVKRAWIGRLGNMAEKWTWVPGAAYNIAGQRDWTYLSPSNDLDVIAGYGTIGLEILEQCKSVNNIFIPMGAGGLISGVESVIKKFSPNTRVYGVSAIDRMPLADFIDGEYDAEEEYRPSLAASLVTHIDTESETVDLTGGIVHEYLRCTEDEIMRALRMLAFEKKVSVEGSAALALAGFNKFVSELEGDTSVIILSGGNADAELIERVV